MTAWHGRSAGCRVAQMGRELTRELDRHDLVALGVQEQDRHVERLDRGGLVVLGEQRVERGDVGLELERVAGQATSQPRPRSPGRSHTTAASPRRPRRRSQDSRPCSTRGAPPAAPGRRCARAAAPPSRRCRRTRGRPSGRGWHRDRAGRTRSRRARRRARRARSRDGSPCTIRRRAGSRRRRAPGCRFGQPQRVGEPVPGADLGRERLGGGSQSARIERSCQRRQRPA